MVAADTLAMAEKRERAARAKAVAWAWYQRSGGSTPPSAGRSEAFATRCATRRSSSRFQREAASRLRALAMAASFASTASDSALTCSFSSMDNSSSLSHECSASFEDATDPEELSSSSDQVSATACLESSGADQENGLALVALHPSACWDCGSSLFDSFELVAMSKRLDAELQNLNLDSESGSQDDCSAFGSGGLDRQHQQALLPLSDAPYDSVSPPPSPPLPHLYDSDEAYDAIFDTRQKLASPATDVISKQEVYDMFCQYREASKHVAEAIGKQSPAEPTCADQPKKQKGKSGRMSLHVLAKALHNLRHPSSNLGSDTKVRDYSHRHRHRPPYSPHHKAGSRSLSMQGYGGHLGASRLGEWLSGDDLVDQPQHLKARHIHHHHHHHYHYLFHSDDDFRLQPLDKSLMVAAAGLRSPKINPAPGRGDFTVDYGRKWADLGTLHTSVGTNLEHTSVGTNLEQGKTF